METIYIYEKSCYLTHILQTSIHNTHNALNVMYIICNTSKKKMHIIFQVEKYAFIYLFFVGSL